MIGPTVPLSAVAQALEQRLPSATSSQLPVLHRLRRNLDARCAQIEQSVKPDVTAPRPLAEQSRAREAARLPPPPRARRRRAEGAAGAIVPRRPAVGTVTVVAGQERRGFADGPALEARFDSPWGMVKMSDGAIIIADHGHHRLRKLQNGVVTTLAGGER